MVYGYLGSSFCGQFLNRPEQVHRLPLTSAVSATSKPIARAAKVQEAQGFQSSVDSRGREADVHVVLRVADQE